MKKYFILVLALFLIALSACSSKQENVVNETSNASSSEGASSSSSAPSDFAIGTAAVGGLWYTLGGVMQDKMSDIFPESSVTVIESGGMANMMGIGDDLFSLGFVNGTTIGDAENGVNGFEEKVTNSRTIATLYPNVFQIVVRADSDIYTIEDLKGKKVSPGPKGYGGELAFIDVLDSAGMTYDDLGGIEYIGTSDGADLLRDGHIDAITNTIAAPLSTFEELDTTVGIRLISINEEAKQKVHELNPGYRPYTIQAGTYPNQEDDIETVATYTVLISNNNLVNEDTAYEVTKMMIENAEAFSSLSAAMKDFTAEYAVENNIGTLHPGAEKYYREIGVLE